MLFRRKLLIERSRGEAALRAKTHGSRRLKLPIRTFLHSKARWLASLGRKKPGNDPPRRFPLRIFMILNAEHGLRIVLRLLNETWLMSFSVFMSNLC